MSQSVHYSPASLNQSYAAPEIVHQRNRTLAALAVSPGQAILDVGCGTGFLTEQLAHLTTDTGSVQAIDKEADMVAATMERCSAQSQVSAAEGDVTLLNFDDSNFDAVSCTQVLLYVEQVEQAIAEMVRALKPGGRLAILETDWRTTVMQSSYPEITDAVYRSWDQTVPSPNLPVRLKKLMQDAGLSDIHVEGIPLVNSEYNPASFSVSSLDWMSGNAYQQGAISKEQSRLWRDDLAALGDDDAYFFCVNRFLFCGVKT